MAEYDFKTQELLEVQKSHLKVDRELKAEREALSKLRALSKEFITTGSTSTVRSFFEIFIKSFESKQWEYVSYLQHHLFGRVDEYYYLLWEEISETQLEQMKATINTTEIDIPATFDSSISALKLLRLTQYSKEREKKIIYLQHIIEDSHFDFVDYLPNCSKVDSSEVKKSFTSLYRKLCNAVHQSGARFSGDADFLLPRASDEFTVPEVYAMATIVKASGFNPIYPSGEESVGK